MTREAAETQAQADATATGQPVDVWQHVGGRNPKGVVLPTHRYLVRPASAPAPKWDVWQKVATKTP